MPLYENSSIQHEKNTFRLLTLYKGYFNEPIRGQLWVSWIPQNAHDREQKRIDYIALSYTWGGQEKRAEMELNGCTISITENLFSALRHLRSEDKSQQLWVDAICINQEDPRERKHQVGQMKNIYQEALEVYVWLGESTPETDATLNAMIEIQKAKLDVEGDWRPSVQGRIQHDLYSRGDAGEALPVQKGLDELLGRPWFRRIWILQEIASARAARIFCGKKNVSAHVFAQFASLLRIQTNAHCQAVLDIMPGFSRNESWWAQKRDLRTLLLKFRESGATDERDMVYALLGISEDVCAEDALEIDYEPTTTIERVIQRTVCFLLSRGQANLSSYDFLDWNLMKFHQNLSHLDLAVLNEALKKEQYAIARVLLREDNIESALNTEYGWKLLKWENEHNGELILAALRRGMERWTSAEIYALLLKAITEGHGYEWVISASAGAIEVGSKDHAGRTLLSHAAEHGSLAVTEILCALHTVHGQNDADSKDNNGRTPLSYAAQHGYTDISKMLCARADVDPDSQDDTGRTPLSYAAENGSAKAAAILLSRPNVYADSKDSLGRTPLSYAAPKGDTELVELLMERNADAHLRDSSGLSSILHAIREGNVRLVKLFTTRTLLSYPTENVYTALVKRYMDQAMDMGSRDTAAQVLLIYAAKQGKTELAKLLVARNTQLNLRDDLGRMPLSYAAENGCIDIVKLLINNGANVNARDS
ncbi:hypothetical protein N0V90_013228 [Kalmusia sp. IMI 367209]|nr:hypothetical protein N0V90_013228 [Kalmusia sp. IMI 367209]